MAERPRRIRASLDLQRKAVNFKAGVDIDPDDALLEKLDTVVAESSDLFLKEMATAIATMRREFRSARIDPSESATFVVTAKAQSYVVKSLGGTFGYPLLTQIAKSLNDYVTEVYLPTEEQLSLIGLHVDALSAVLVRHITGDGGRVESAVLAAFRKATETIR